MCTHGFMTNVPQMPDGAMLAAIKSTSGSVRNQRSKPKFWSSSSKFALDFLHSIGYQYLPIMALRSLTQLRSFLSRLKAGSGNPSFATSTSPKMKPHVPTADIHAQEPDTKFWRLRGEFAPVYVALGLIVMSTSVGLYTGLHHLRRNPSVYVKKSRRETVPELEEPEQVVEKADEFITKSLFRKVAHVQDFDRQDIIPNPISGDVYAWKQHLCAETLKDVGVEPPKDYPPKDVGAYRQRP